MHASYSNTARFPLSRARSIRPSMTCCSVPSFLDGMDDIPRDLLRRREHALIVWDVENVQPFLPTSSIPIQIHRLKSILSHLGCEPHFSLSIVAAINSRTMKRYQGSPTLQLLLASGVVVSTVSDFADAADKSLINSAYGFIQDHRDNGVLMLISNDKGFSEVLQYAESKGILSIHLAPPHRLKPWDLALPSSHQPLKKKGELGNASSLALVWQSQPQCLISLEEGQWNQECHVRAGLPYSAALGGLAPGIITHASCKSIKT